MRFIGPEHGFDLMDTQRLSELRSTPTQNPLFRRATLPIVLVVTLLAGAVTLAVAASLPSVPTTGENSCDPKEIVPVLGDSSKSITRQEYMELIRLRLEQESPHFSGKSLRQILAGYNYDMEFEEECPVAPFIAMKDGSKRRIHAVPDSLSSLASEVPGKRISAGLCYGGYGKVRLTQRSTGKTTLLEASEPWEPIEGVWAPSFVLLGEEASLPVYDWKNCAVGFASGKGGQ